MQQEMCVIEALAFVTKSFVRAHKDKEEGFRVSLRAQSRYDDIKYCLCRFDWPFEPLTPDAVLKFTRILLRGGMERGYVLHIRNGNSFYCEERKQPLPPCRTCSSSEYEDTYIAV